MRIRLPLYSKILLWFFLNLVVAATLLVIIFNAQFHVNMDWFFATGARERMEAVRDLVIGDLEVTPPDEWGAVMRRYSTAYHVRLGLFDDDADWVIGEVLSLPEAVHQRIVERPPFGRPRRNSEEPNATSPPRAPPPPEISAGAKEPPGRRRWPRFPLRALMRTTDPTHYWLLTSARLDNPLAGEPMRVVLVARSNTISAGGLIFDPKPWIALGVGVVLFSLLFWLPLVRGITRTIGKMMNTTRQIAAGRFDVRVNLQRRDELGTLAESIDQMAARLDGLVKGQKRFLGDIAHELCSPLARLQLALTILEGRGPGDQTKLLASAREKAEQIAAL
ncbi:MAG: HAMP domain-containing protein, partial [Chthoniobacteraceae bacterium]